jgi:transcription antitermination factor NusA-like protein
LAANLTGWKIDIQTSGQPTATEPVQGEENDESASPADETPATEEPEETKE